MSKKHISIIFSVLIMMCMTGSVFGDSYQYIENSDFEDGSIGFGVCYSSRKDTHMPSIKISSGGISGKKSLEFIPSEDLAEKSSTSPQSSGFSYQGIYSKSEFSADSSKNYSISAYVYSKEAVKARFIMISENKMIGCSDEFLVTPKKWNSLKYNWYPQISSNDVTIRLGFYDIKRNESIYIDDFCAESSASNNLNWTAISNESIEKSSDSVKLRTGNDGTGMYMSLNKDFFEDNVLYAVSGRINSENSKSYVSIACGDNAYESYVLSSLESIDFVIPFYKSAIENDNFKITVTASQQSVIELTDFSVCSEDSFIKAVQNGDKLDISGKLRHGNENAELALDITDIGQITLTADSNAGYGTTVNIPQFDGARKKLQIKLTDIIGYSDMNNELKADVFVTNDNYYDELSKKVNEAATSDELKKVLSDDVMDDIGIGALDIYRYADKDSVFSYILKNKSENGNDLLNIIKTASLYSMLDLKKTDLSEAVNKYSELIDISNIKAYKEIYANVKNTAETDKIFKATKIRITDKDSFNRAFTETAVKYDVNNQVNYSSKMNVLISYADDLKLDFTEYNKLSSDKQYNAANAITKLLDVSTDYGALQKDIDRIVKEEANKSSGNSGGSGSKNGGSGGVFIGSDTNNGTSNNSSSEFKFTDLENHEWAENEIYVLLSKGIISRSDDKKFNPDRNITRAEFAKMISVMFNLTNKNDKEIFTDVKKSDWYYGYVMALNEAGIVYGISDDTFGSELPISRQDICVIINRIKNNGIIETEKSFTDENQIDSYAKEAVNAAAEAGYINGYDDGSFRPHAPATRAEVAKILYAADK